MFPFQNTTGLAGLGGVAPSLFPDLNTALVGREQEKYNKEPFKLTKYCVEVFDMSKQEDRDKYTELMTRLVPMIQNVKCVINKNELQILSQNGNSGWWRYVEWFEYSINETSLTKKILDDAAEEQQDRQEQQEEEKPFRGVIL